MLAARTGLDPRLDEALGEVTRLRQFSGTPAEFWPAFLAASGKLAGGARGFLLLRDPAQPDRIKKLSEWTPPGHGHADPSTQAFLRSVGGAIDQSIQTGSALIPLSGGLDEAGAFTLACIIPLPQGATEKCVLACLLPEATTDQAHEALARLRLAADVPASFRQAQEIQQSRQESERLASVLDVMVLVNAEKRFLAATLAFCNAVATRFACDRASLGWLNAGYIRLQSISRTDRFDRHMASVKAIEVVMEEALDQNDEVAWPVDESANLVARDHGLYSREQNVSHLCSIPIRVAGKPAGVLTCERESRPFAPHELQQLRLACDQASVRLSELHKIDRWFGSRWAAALKDRLGSILGPEHTWAKVGVVAGAAGLVLMCLPIFPYRVEGNFILRGSEVAFLTAPYDGYIREAAARPGDLASSNSVLLRLDTADLELEEANAQAEVQRYLREAEKARADAERNRSAARAVGLADMKINQALVEQSKKRLEILQFRLSQSQIRAPFNSVIIEGDLRQRIGSPVKLGDLLFRVARIDALYVEAEVNEADIHEVLGKSAGEIAFVTQPKFSFPIRIARIEPAAMPKEGKNVFVIRCDLASAVEPWWRPGMSGVCKIDAGKRALIWILTHRTVDFLRLLLWW